MGHGDRRTFGCLLAAVFVPLLLAGPAGALTITELHPRPPAGGPNLQFVEVYNDASSVVDLSGWSFARGITFEFPEGTFLAGRAYLVVAADAAAIQSRYGIQNVLGNFSGQLSNGETVEIVNRSGVKEVEVSYKDHDLWPSGHRGTGHTLSLRGPYLDPDDGVNWTWSAEAGGTPGQVNFPPPDQTFEETEAIGRHETWRYKKGVAPFSEPAAAWCEVGFDESSWLTGATGIGYGDSDDATQLTDMQDSYMSFAARKSFSLTAAEIAAVDSVVLGLDYDDGFIAYLNGQEFARAGLGSPGEEVSFDQAADDHEAGVEEEFPVPRDLLVEGENVLAVEVHNTQIDSSDASFIPRLLLRRSIAPEAGSPVVLNELFARTGGERWVELHNSSGAPISIGGYHLSDDPARPAKFTIPPLTLPARGFAAFGEAETGLDLSTAEVFLLLGPEDTGRIADARLFEVAGPAIRDGTSDARFPDGAGRWVIARTPTRGAANQLDVERDIVINEIMYHPYESRAAAGQPFESRPGEYIELYNRGSRDIPLAGYAFTKGIDFAFPADAHLAAGRYLVVAADPAYIAATYGLAGVLGPWQGSLQHDGETIRLEDPWGNAADEVRYSDGGEWSELADGGGSSLELIDPRQDHSAGSAWAASDETGKSAWTQLSYTGTYQELGESLFHFTPMDAGSFLLDDVEILRGAVNYVPNTGFETGTAPWVMEGTLVHSKRITAEAHSGSACLEVTATDRGDMRMNRLAVPTQPAMTAGTYTVRFWARWLSGANLILAHGFDNDMARALWMPVPGALGTPGAENSATRALRLAAGSVNLGPIICDAAQSPARPDYGQATSVTAVISDADGVASATVFYALNRRGGAFTPVTMAPSAVADGAFSALLPGFDTGTKVLYYFEATDSTGQSRRLPVDAPARTFLYQVGPAEGGDLGSYRLIIDDDTRDELDTRPIHSDDPLYGSFVFDDQEIHHLVAFHYHGSQAERPRPPPSFKLSFPGDRPFHGAKKFNISKYGAEANDALSHYLIARSGSRDSPSPNGDYQFVRWSVNDEGLEIRGRVETVDGSLLKRWFPGQSDGPLYRANPLVTFYLDGSYNLTRWSSIEYKGADKERYRWNWDLHTRELEDDWTRFVDLMRTLDPQATPGEGLFETRIAQMLDVDELLRVLAVRVLNDDWDTVGLRNGQNLYFYYATAEGRWKYMPWDMDGTFMNFDATFSPDSDPGLKRILDRPVYQRRFLQSMQRILDTTWSVERIRPFLDPSAAAGVQNVEGVIGFVNARRPNALAYLDRGGTFRILTNSGNDFQVASDTVAIQGEAPLAVTIITLGNDPPPQLTFSDVLRFSTVAPIIPGPNLLDFLGFDAEGNFIAEASITVTNTLTWSAPTVASVTPAAGPLSGGTQVSIRGEGFHIGARVDFDGAAAVSATLVSSTQIQAVSPPGTGVVPVKVTNLDGQSGILSAGFTYLIDGFIRGDANRDGAVDLADALKILFYLFAGEPLDCEDAADIDDGETLDLTDPIALLQYLFLDGPPPAAPFPTKGNDPAGDELGCLR